MSSTDTTQHPKFKNPPVVETILGVQFEPIEGFTNAHLGAFWHFLGDEWVDVEDAPLIPQQSELFEDEKKLWRSGFSTLQLTQESASRLWIRTLEHDRLIQVQRDRFHYNWTGHKGEKYPSYDKMRPQFDAKFNKFETFLNQVGLAGVKPNQWEVTYVNHLPKGTVWQAPSDWADVFSSSAMFGVPLNSLNLEGVNCEWRYEIESQRGRLHVQLRNGRRDSSDVEESLLLKLTARGPIDNREENGLESGLDLGHDVIVTSFKQLMSDKARMYWGEIHDDG